MSVSFVGVGWRYGIVMRPEYSDPDLGLDLFRLGCTD